MLSVEDEVRIRAPLARVFARCWDVEGWPRLTEHVKRIELLEARDGYQRFAMTVESNGTLHTVESQRFATGAESIRYEQLRPPRFLRRHEGEWRMTELGGEVQVRLIHRAELDDAVVREALGAATLDEARERVATALKANGRKTLEAIKRVLEASSAD